MANLQRALLGAVLALATGCGGGGGEPPLNVVLVTLDTTRADFLSCYGGARPTPALDALAAAGTRFDLAMSTASVTPVSHASILTGLYNHEHGLRVIYAGGGYRLPEGAETLATVLAARGYHTRAVHSAFPVSRFFGLDRGFEQFDDLNTELDEHDGEYQWDVLRFQRRSDETSDRVLDGLGEGEPFFLWVHYWDPHDVAKGPPGISPQEARAMGLRGFYAEEVVYMDSQVGRLLDGLRERGLWDRTLVVVVADHGQGLGDHAWIGHRLLYQEQIRVPLIVRVPGVDATPEVADLVRTVDVFPTVLDYLGVPPPGPVSGRSLRPLIEGAPDEPRVMLADQINGYDWNAGALVERPLDQFLYLAMDRDWKLTWRPLHPRRSELFHLAEDPREEHNLFAERPDEATRLMEVLAAEAPWVAAPFEATGGADAGAQEALGALGYTGSDEVDAHWAWTCPRHLEQRWEGGGGCPECGSPPLLVGTPK